MAEGSQNESEQEKLLQEISLYDAEREIDEYTRHGLESKSLQFGPARVKRDFEKILRKYENDLAEVGIKLELAEKEGIPSSVNIHLFNPKRFLEYMDVTLNNNMLEGEELGERFLSLRRMLNDIIWDFTRNADLENPDDSTLEFLGSFEDITETFSKFCRKLNITENNSMLEIKLKSYLEKLKNKQLREYIDEEREKLK